MKFTGERMQNHPNSSTYRFHMDRYIFAKKFIQNKSVLDIACGSGYGTSYLAQFASSVTGADIDPAIITYCKEHYKKKNLDFQTISSSNPEPHFISLFDAIISFETLEHADNGTVFLKNILSYLRPGGILILSTPNNFNNIHPPKNRFHVYEYNILELKHLIEKLAPSADIQLFGQFPSNARKMSPRVKQSLLHTIISSMIRNIYL
ncbi:MAG: class I SAM-dependent methyltransferase, partial [Candidatus Andersenbacteria bacterium]